MIYGIGTDIILFSRVESVYNKYKNSFEKKFLSDYEVNFLQKLKSHSLKIRFLAKRIAAKEAFAKSVLTGLRYPIYFNNITVKKASLGNPYLEFNDEINNFLNMRKIIAVNLSISDEKNCAIAFVITEKG